MVKVDATTPAALPQRWSPLAGLRRTPDALAGYLRPSTALQHALFDLLVSKFWRLMRVSRIETDILEKEAIGPGRRFAGDYEYWRQLAHRSRPIRPVSTMHLLQSAAHQLFQFADGALPGLDGVVGPLAPRRRLHRHRLAESSLGGKTKNAVPVHCTMSGGQV